MSNNTTWNDESARAALRRIFDAAVKSADPAAAVRRHLPEKPRGRCVVVGAGKGAAVMAAAVDAAWPDVDVSGVVVTRYGHAVPAGRIEVLQAAHPVPDEASVQASTRILQAVQGLGPDDLVVALISGGGSSLLTLPGPGMTLADKQALNRILLASGATINEMNVLRRQLSAIKGGRLAQATLPARLCTLIISDVPGDDPAAIASGPTIADPATREEARAIVARYRMELPDADLHFDPADVPEFVRQRLHPRCIVHVRANCDNLRVVDRHAIRSPDGSHIHRVLQLESLRRDLGGEPRSIRALRDAVDRGIDLAVARPGESMASGV